MAKYIDLHVHTLHSDGLNTPKEVLDMAIQNETKYISICDHNTLKGNIIARKIIEDEKLNIEIIKGIEIDSNYKDKLYKTFHVLGYNCNDELLQVYLDELERRNTEFFYEKFEFFKNNFNDKMDIDEFFSLYNISSRPEQRLMDYLVHKGFVENRYDLYEKYNIQNNFDDIRKVVEIITKSGGVAVLAHPTRYEDRYKIAREELSALVLELKNYGLKGVESMYSLNSKEQTEYWTKFALDNNLIYTCGSDFHQIAEPERVIKLEIAKGDRNNLNVSDENIIKRLKKEF